MSVTSSTSAPASAAASTAGTAQVQSENFRLEDPIFVRYKKSSFEQDQEVVFTVDQNTENFSPTTLREALIKHLRTSNTSVLLRKDAQGNWEYFPFNVQNMQMSEMRKTTIGLFSRFALPKGLPAPVQGQHFFPFSIVVMFGDHSSGVGVQYRQGESVGSFQRSLNRRIESVFNHKPDVAESYTKAPLSKWFQRQGDGPWTSFSLRSNERISQLYGTTLCIFPNGLPPQESAPAPQLQAPVEVTVSA